MSKINIRPLHDKIVVKRVESEEKSPGGIIIPDTAKDKPVQGVVVAIGSGTRDKDGRVIPLDIKVGERVLFAKWGGTEVKIEGEEYLVIKESDVLAVMG